MAVAVFRLYQSPSEEELSIKTMNNAQIWKLTSFILIFFFFLLTTTTVHNCFNMANENISKILM